MYYDHDMEFSRVYEFSVFMFPAWITERAIDDTWYFAALMSDGDVVGFSHFFGIASDDGLMFGVHEHEDNEPTREEGLDNYRNRVFKNGRICVDAENICTKIGNNERLWFDADLSEESSYNPYRKKVSINSRYISGFLPSKGKKGFSTIIIPMPGIKKSSRKVNGFLTLDEVVMFFETADT